MARTVAWAIAIFREKVTDERGNIYEAVIWKIDRSRRYPEGVRYRLAFIRVEETYPAVLYDNHHPKGHHRHIRNQEYNYNFESIEKLMQDFRRDVQREVKNENIGHSN